MAARIHQPCMADPDAEYESIRPGLLERAAAIHHCRRVSRPNVGDAGRNLDLAGGRKDDGRGCEDLPGEVFAYPDGAETHLLDLSNRASQVAGRQERHRAQPGGGAPEV